MVSVRAFYSNDSSSNYSEVHNFSVKIAFEKNKKRPGLAL